MLMGKMQHVPIDEVEEGMVVAQDVPSPAGHPLITKGAALNASLIESLKNYGVSGVWVQSDEPKEETFDEEAVLEAEEACRNRVLGRFRKSPSDPMMKAVFATVLRLDALEYLRCRKKS